VTPPRLASQLVGSTTRIAASTETDKSKMSKNEAPMDANALARLKRLTGKSTLVLTHYGRRSGKPYEVKIWFVVDRDKVFIGTENVLRQWVRNVQKNPRIKLSVGSEKFEAEARFLDDPAERDRALAAMGRKYWMYSPIFALGKLLTAIGLMRNRTGAFKVTLLP
jgi:deazaflavin-dependent oxidoreductase (nitroreductase family)